MLNIKVVYIFLLGLCLGSFLNVIRFRYPKSISIVRPASFCPKCKKKIPFYLNIPILSWIYLGGKCKFCNSKISISYPFIELLTASLFILNGFSNLTFTTKFNLNLIGICIFTFLLIIISLIDIDNMIIPNRILLFGSILGILFNFTSNILLGNKDILFIFNNYIFFSFISLISLEILNFIISLFIKKDAFGFGDSKYLFMICTWIGIKGVISSFILSLYIGGIIILILLIFKKIKYSGKIPYGPFLSIGAYISCFFGPDKIIYFLKNFYYFI